MIKNDTYGETMVEILVKIHTRFDHEIFENNKFPNRLKYILNSG